jgi:hypothetical protein
MRVRNCEQSHPKADKFIWAAKPADNFFQRSRCAAGRKESSSFYPKHAFSLSVLKHSLLRLQLPWSPHGALHGSRIRPRRLNRSPLNSSFERPSTDKNLVFRHRLSGSLTSKNSMNSKAESARNLKTIFVGIGSI